MAADSMDHAWGWLKPEEQDFDAVLRRLLHEASEVIPGLSPDLKQADPVVVMLLRAFAREYVELYRLLDDSVGMAYRTLVTRLLTFPHAPEPATTVLYLKAKDPGTRIPTDFQAVTAQPILLGARRSAQAHFSPLSEGHISSFEVAALVLVRASGEAVRLPDPALPGQGDRWQAPSRRAPALFLALDSPAPGAEDRAEVFLYGSDPGVRECLWSPWDVPAAAAGPSLSLHGGPPEPPFVPGEAFHEALPFDPPIFTFRSDARRLESPYASQFVAVGGAPLLSQACAAPREVGEPGPVLPPARGKRHWVRVQLAEGADLDAVLAVRARTNAVLAANRELRTSGALPVDDTPNHSWNLPEDVTLDNLLRLESVLDRQSGYAFLPADTREGADALRSYRLVEWTEGERRRVRAELWNRAEPRRRTEIEIQYSLTLGPMANGLDPGTISLIFTPAHVFPGLLSVTNLVPSVGGRPGRSAHLQEAELRSSLRHRGRAVVPNDYLEMAVAFDPGRVRGVTLGRGVARRGKGLRSSVEVRAQVTPSDFVNALERESFRRRMEGYLQDRSPMGETVQVVLAEPAR